jgi:hypothetical protein
MSGPMDDAFVYPDQFIDPSKLIEALQKVPPGCMVVKNRVGNLAIMRDGFFVGYIDLRTCEVDLFEQEG